jgi:hypothetical protein
MNAGGDSNNQQIDASPERDAAAVAAVSLGGGTPHPVIAGADSR